MNRKIVSLTPQQEQLLKQRYQEWLAVGRNCEPLNHAEARTVVNEFYRRLGKPEPLILVLSSPMMCLLAAGALQLRSQLGSELGSQFRFKLGSQLGSRIRSRIRSQLRSQLWSQFESQLELQLGSQLGSQLRSQLELQLGSQFWSQLRNYFAGQHWCCWAAFYAFCREIGVNYAQPDIDLLELWEREARALHWWFPFDGFVLLSERHTRLVIDDRGRLHSESGQACGYADGWGVWAWHGVNVDQRIIEKPESITAREIQEELNAEVRRVLVERYGLSRYLLDSGAKQLAADEFGELYRTELPDDEPLVMVKVLNSTPEPDGSKKPYFLRVHHECRPMLPDGELGEAQKPTALNAVASTFGMTGKQYLRQLVCET